jgi:hypothetical protein
MSERHRKNAAVVKGPDNEPHLMVDLEEYGVVRVNPKLSRKHNYDRFRIREIYNIVNEYDVIQCSAIVVSLANHNGKDFDIYGVPNIKGAGLVYDHKSKVMGSSALIKKRGKIKTPLLSEKYFALEQIYTATKKNVERVGFRVTEY